MIKKITRGTIVVLYKGMELTIEGEAFLRGYGAPDYVIYSDSICGWDPPNESLPFNEGDKKNVVRDVTAELSIRGMSFEVQ